MAKTVILMAEIQRLGSVSDAAAYRRKTLKAAGFAMTTTPLGVEEVRRPYFSQKDVKTGDVTYWQDEYVAPNIEAGAMPLQLHLDQGMGGEQPQRTGDSLSPTLATQAAYKATRDRAGDHCMALMASAASCSNSHAMQTMREAAAFLIDVFELPDGSMP